MRFIFLLVLLFPITMQAQSEPSSDGLFALRRDSVRNDLIDLPIGVTRKADFNAEPECELWFDEGTDGLPAVILEHCEGTINEGGEAVYRGRFMVVDVRRNYALQVLFVAEHHTKYMNNACRVWFNVDFRELRRPSQNFDGPRDEASCEDSVGAIVSLLFSAGMITI